MMDEEIRQALSEVQEMKKMCGNINMKLNNIVTQRGQDYKKKLEAEYQRGLSDGNDIGYKDGVKDGQNEAWECAKKLFSTMSEPEIEKVFPTEWENGFYGLMQMKPQYAIAKLKAYEEKESEEIKVGDIIANNTEPKLKVWVTHFDEIGFCGIAITDFGTVDKGELYASCSPKGWHKIGRFDINKILERVVL